MFSLRNAVLLGGALALIVTCAASRKAVSGPRDQLLEPPPCLRLGGPELPALNPLDDPPLVAFTPDLHLVALPARGFVWIGDPFTNRLVRKLPLRKAANAWTFSPDGKILAVAAEDIQLWDVAPGKQTRHFGKALGDNARLLFSGDGTVLASRNPDASVDLWDPATGKRRSGIDSEDTETRTLSGVDAWTMTLSFDGKLLASKHRDDGKTIQMWDTRSGKRLRTCEGHGDEIICLAFSADGATLASGSNDATIRLWDVGTGKERRCLKGHKDGVMSVAWAAGGRLLVSTGPGRTIRLWEVATGKECSREFVPPRTRIVAGGPKGKRFACLTETEGEGPLHFWEITEHNKLQPLSRSGGPILSFAFLADGKHLTTTDVHGSVRIWDVSTGTECSTSLARSPRGVVLANPALHVALDPPPRTTFPGDGEDENEEKPKRIVVRSTRTGKPLHRLALGPVPDAVAASPDNRFLAAASSADRLIRVWSPARGHLLHQLDGPLDWIAAGGLTPGMGLGAIGINGALGGQFGIAGGGAGLAGGPLHALVFSPDGRTLAGSWPGTFRLWDTQTGRLRRSFHAAGPKVSWGGEQIAFSADGRTLAARKNSVLRLWEVRTGGLRAEVRLDRRNGLDLQFALSPDGRTVAITQAGAKTIAFWDLFFRREACAFRVEQVAVALAFSPDGGLLAGETLDHAIRLWNLAAWKHRARPPDRSLSAQELEQAWTGLADPDAANAYRAITRLAQGPGASVPFLKQRLKPVPVEKGRELARLIAELDADDYPTREAAHKRLLTWGSQAEPALCDTLRKDPSPEVRRRIERILAQVASRLLDGGYLREMRALEALECAGTREARAVLAALAQGGAEVELTREAATSLERLDRRRSHP